MSTKEETQNVAQQPLPIDDTPPGLAPEIAAILSQSGKQAEEVGKLVALNNQLQQKINDLSDKLNEARRRARDAEGTAEDNQNKLKQYQKLGDLETIETALQKAQTLQTEAEQLKEENTQMQQQIQDTQQLSERLTKLQREMTLRDVAEATGYKRRVLSTLVSDDMKFNIEEADEGPVVNVVIGEQEPVDINDYAEKNWRDFLPALKPTPKNTETDGVTFVKQPEGQPPSTPGDVLLNYLAQAKKARASIPSPFSEQIQQ